MAISTSLLGPYDDLSTADKIIVSGAIPGNVRERLFTIFLPRRGAVDKVITKCLYMIDAYLVEHEHLYEFDEDVREEIVNNLINNFIVHLQQLDPMTLVTQPEIRTTNPAPNSHVQSML